MRESIRAQWVACGVAVVATGVSLGIRWLLKAGLGCQSLGYTPRGADRGRRSRIHAVHEGDSRSAHAGNDGGRAVDAQEDCEVTNVPF
jgi:hypothetical protein